MTGELYIGLMSGTSVDAIDAVLLQHPAAQGAGVLGHYQLDIDSQLRGQIMALSSREDDSLELTLELDWKFAGLFAEATRGLLQQTGKTPGEIRAIGCHGQTMRHCPATAQPEEQPSYSLQIGDANRLAELTGIDVVADFRRRDIAAGGQAAPLVPAFHAHWFGLADIRQVVVNLGGIANLTLLDGTNCVGGFDSGPANGLMNSWIFQKLGKEMDRNGEWARGGQIAPALLDEMLADPWFSLPAPKSTGRELFNLDWVNSKQVERLAEEDVQRTLLELTATSLVDAIHSSAFDAQRIILCGGGCYNVALVNRIEALAGNVAVDTCSRHGIEPEQVEAAAFAWLAHQRVHQLPGNVVSVTGAKGPRVLGALYKA